MRAFFALPAEAAWVESAREFEAGVRSRLPHAAWTRPESWHLTVRFLGEIAEEAAERFSERVGEAAAGLAVSALAPVGPVVLPPRGRARVLGIGFAPPSASDGLAEVVRVAEGAARSIGCPPEERPFRPHVTLARLREPWPRAAVEDFCRAARAWTFPPWRVRSLVLFRSRLDPAGAVHTPVREWVASAAVSEAKA